MSQKDLDLYFNILSLFAEEAEEGPACLGCGCTEWNPCPGGCGWSIYYLWRGFPICTRCEAFFMAFEINAWVMYHLHYSIDRLHFIHKGGPEGRRPLA